MANTLVSRSMLAALALGIILLLSSSLMAQSKADDDAARYLEIRNAHQAALLKLPGVEGVGVGLAQDDPTRAVIRVYVRPGTSSQARQALPRVLDGAPVEVVEVVLQDAQ